MTDNTPRAEKTPLVRSRKVEDVGEHPTEWVSDDTWLLEQWNYAWSEEDHAYMVVVPASKRESDQRVMCMAMTPNQQFAHYLCQMQQRNLWEREMQTDAPSKETPVTGKEQVASPVDTPPASKTEPVRHGFLGGLSEALRKDSMDTRALDL